jgi:hypothetical protein
MKTTYKLPKSESNGEQIHRIRKESKRKQTDVFAPGKDGSCPEHKIILVGDLQQVG